MLAVVAATDRELSAFFSAPRATNWGEEGKINWGKGAFLFLSTGVGVINAASALSAFLCRYSVNGVLHVGVGGSYDPKRLPLGSLCVAEREVLPEFGVFYSGRIVNSGLGFPQAQVGERDIFETLYLSPELQAENMQLLLPGKAHREIFLTVSGVSGNRSRALELEKTYSAGVENMEGFALALVAGKAGIPFLQIRSISNAAGSRERKDWDFSAAFSSLGELAEQLFQ